MSDSQKGRVRAGPIVRDAALPRPCEARGCRACGAALATGPAGGPTGGGAPPQPSHAHQGDAEPVGVAVVGDDKAARRLVLGVLHTSPEFQCCGCFSTAAEALDAIPKLPVRIALVGLSLPDLCGIQCVQALRLLRPGLRIVLTAAVNTDPSVLRRALAAGADEVCLRPVDAEKWLGVLHLAAAPVRPSVGAAPPTHGAASIVHHPPCTNTRRPILLTEREEQVLGCLAQGLQHKEVAGGLHISLPMAEKLLQSIFHKLGVPNGTTAVLKWAGLRR